MDQHKKHKSMNDFVRAVQAYFAMHGRHDLPWRKTHDPYHILVSEMMLQQTQVTRVIPYYENFLREFPTMNVLAQKKLGAVLKMWSGLGYNRRAKFLHGAAQAVVAHNRGVVPRSYDDLRALPGVGDYTAKAVRIFAYNEREVCIETNIRTVFIHHFFPQARRVDDARLMPLIAQALAQVDSPREWYAALMDYGVYLKETKGNSARKSTVYTKQKAFRGSPREARGRVLRALLKGLAMDEKSLLKATTLPKKRLIGALASLRSEDMIKKVGKKWSA
ncbi:MAG: A/G-specific adenine glycosylase [Patescibacteria group bacterium]